MSQQAFDLAVQHHQQGCLREAETLYQEVLRANPNHADAWHLLGIIALEGGQYAKALEYIGEAIHLNGAVAGFQNNFGLAAESLGRVAEAESHYRRALAIDPALARAHINLGHVLHRQGKLDEAAASYLPAVALTPNSADAHNSLGTVRLDQGQFDEAVVFFRRALELKPGYAEALDNLGSALSRRGDVDEAGACLRRALELKPDFAEAHSHLGHVLLKQGMVAEARVHYLRALELKDDYAEVHNNLGIVERALGQLDAATRCWQRVIELRPDWPDAHANLGHAFEDQGKLDEAIACYRQALKLRPDSVHAHSSLCLTLYRHPGYDNQAILDEHRRWNRQHAERVAGGGWRVAGGEQGPLHPPPATLHAPPATLDAPRRLRIGYVSSNLRAHVVGRNLVPLFREHDRSRFHIICYSGVVVGDAFTELFRGYAGDWRNVASWSDERLAQQIRDDAVDILVDLALHTDSRLTVFARKPAPVQVTFAGYPGTTGLAAIDYRLTDPYLDPPGLLDRYYTEESIRLPHSFWCYDPATEEPTVNPLPASQKQFITFGCLNSLCKINVHVLSLWARVLQAVRDSRLLLLAPEGTHRQQTAAVLSAHGISSDRVAFVPHQPQDAYLKTYHGIDLGLDTFPYNGHTTSLDSYWMGVPVVTLVGQTVVGRAGLSQLTNLGLELIADSPERFVDIAVNLANDWPRLAGFRATLRQRMRQSPLMDANGFARGIESAYQLMWGRWCAR